MSGGLAPWHWALIIAAFVILFGSKRLPDAARGLGRSLRIFKSEVSEMRQDSSTPQPSTPTTPAQLSGTQAAPTQPAEASMPQPHPPQT